MRKKRGKEGRDREKRTKEGHGVNDGKEGREKGGGKEVKEIR